MPEITNEELGRRMFAVQKEKATEEAIEKIRQSPESEWNAFTHTDRMVLDHLLGEAWVSLEREEWEKYAFSRLTAEDLREMIVIGQKLEAKRMTEDTAVAALAVILSRTIE